MNIFKLPDLGEGLVEAEILSWHVQEGDEVRIDQVLVAVETAKAIVDIPSPQAGRIKHCFGKPGEFVHVGDPLIAYEGAAVADPGSVVGKVEVGQAIVHETPIAVGRAATGVRATPAVRALAHRLEVDLALVTPSGADGMVTSTLR